MNDAVKEAAYIMRNHPIKTQGDIFDVAKARAVTNDTGKGAFLDPDGDEVGHAWAVVDAHYANREEPGYRALAGLEPILVDEDA
jgi:cytochrome c551/c552